MHVQLSGKSLDIWDTSDAHLFLQHGFTNEIGTPTLTVELLWPSQGIQMLLLTVYSSS